MENWTAFLNGTSPELHLTGRNGVFKCLFLSMEKKMHLFYEEMYLNLCFLFSVEKVFINATGLFQ